MKKIFLIITLFFILQNTHTVKKLLENQTTNTVTEAAAPSIILPYTPPTRKEIQKWEQEKFKNKRKAGYKNIFNKIKAINKPHNNGHTSYSFFVPFISENSTVLPTINTKITFDSDQEENKE